MRESPLRWPQELPSFARIIKLFPYEPLGFQDVISYFEQTGNNMCLSDFTSAFAIFTEQNHRLHLLRTKFSSGLSIA